MTILLKADTWLTDVKKECSKFHRALKPFPKTKREFYIRYSGIDVSMIKLVPISDERLFEIAF